ncbi:MAG: peptide deformylase [Candidatus Omnitrophota bacterium]
MTTRLKLRPYGDPCLRKPAKTVLSVGIAEKLLIRELIPAMYAFDGRGLAANQVGITENIFVADVGEGPFAVINPEILEVSEKKTVLEEGCLSLPGIHVKVKRPAQIRVRYLSERNETVEVDLGDLPAKIFQHEIDHLNGKLIIDHASKAEMDSFAEKLSVPLKKKGKPGA